jgi:ubiquinone biosynthesis accessory factor UbiJ
MTTAPPFGFPPIPDFLKAAMPEPFKKLFTPPQWLVEEGQRRIVLLLNHVLAQEKQATERILRQKGRVVSVKWSSFTMQFIATPAGLIDIAPIGARADLALTVEETSPLALAQAALKGEKPAIRVEGDVQLAAEVNWLVDHVRWDAEEDLSRIMGDAPAHTLMQGVQQMASMLKSFAAKTPFATPFAQNPASGQASPSGQAAGTQAGGTAPSSPAQAPA